VAGLVVGRISDKYRGHKRILVVCTLGCGLAAVWFALLVQGSLPGSSGSAGFAQIFASALLIQMLVNACVPVFFELAMEATHGLAEGTTLMLMTTLNNAGGMILLSVPLQGNAVIFNWLFPATALVLALALAMFASDSHMRQHVDDGLEPEAKVEGQDAGLLEGWHALG